MKLSDKNILLLSTGDSIGGAYELMYRIANALQPECNCLCLAVKNQRYTDQFIKTVPLNTKRKGIIYKIKNKFLSIFQLNKPELGAVADSKYVFYYQEEETQTFVTAEQILDRINFVPNVIFIGLTTGFLTTNEIVRLWQLTNAIIVYVVLDVYPLTGGCHVMANCENYKHECKNCPAVTDTKLSALPYMQFLVKKNAYNLMNPYFLGNSLFLKRLLNDVSLKTKQLPIYSCIPTDVFNSKCRSFAKEIWGIDRDRFVILAGADNVKDPRKGRKYVVEALRQLYDINPAYSERILVVLVGNHNNVDEETQKIPFSIKYVDYIRDMRLLSLLYQASDLYVMSSLEEAGPMMVPEAMLCGTMVLGFQTGFLEGDDIIQDGINGYRVPVGDSNKLSETLNIIINLPHNEIMSITNNAQQTALSKMSDKAFINLLKKCNDEI